jgi:hypothetical protein
VIAVDTNGESKPSNAGSVTIESPESPYAMH